VCSTIRTVRSHNQAIKRLTKQAIKTKRERVRERERERERESEREREIVEQIL